MYKSRTNQPIHQQTDITALNNKRWLVSKEEKKNLNAHVRGHPAKYCTLCKNHNKLKQNQQNKKVQIQAFKEVLKTSMN